jgi:hypothetical protein
MQECPERTSPDTPEFAYLQQQMTGRDSAQCFCIVAHTSAERTHPLRWYEESIIEFITNNDMK